MSRVNIAELAISKPERPSGPDLQHGHPTLKCGLTMSKERDKWKIYRQIASNIVLGLLYVLFAVGMTRNVVLTHRVSSLLLLLYELLVALFAFMRNFTKRVSVSTFEWFAATMGTYLPLLLRATAHGRDNPLLVGIQVVGILVSMTGLLSLNTSFGIVPADRGIKTGGLYRVIRHPLYAGYLVSIGAFTAMNPSGANIGIYVWIAAFEIARLLLEEVFLSANTEYAAYLRKVRWRLIPFVF